MKCLLSLILSCLVYSSLYSQSNIEITTGLSNSNFYTWHAKDEYKTDYRDYNNYLFSVIYKERYNKNLYHGIELENSRFISNVESEYLAGYSSYYHNVQYEMNLLTLFFLIEKEYSIFKNTGLFLNVSPFAGYSIFSKAQGAGWDYIYKTRIDSNGNEINYITKDHWTKNEKNTKDLEKYILGLRLGIGFKMHLNEKFSLAIRNSYSFGVNNIMKNENLNYTSARKINFSIGIIYSPKSARKKN